MNNKQQCMAGVKKQNRVPNTDLYLISALQQTVRRMRVIVTILIIVIQLKNVEYNS